MRLMSIDNQTVDSDQVRDFTIQTWDPKSPLSMQKVTDRILDFFGYRVGDYLYDGSPYRFTGYVIEGLRKDIEATNDMKKVQGWQYHIQTVRAYGDVLWDVHLGAPAARLLSLDEVLGIIQALPRY